MGPEVIIVPSAFLMVAFVFYVVANAFVRRQQFRSQSDFQTKLLDRMGNVSEFSAFLNTDGGKRLLGSMAADAAGSGAHQRVLRAFQSGIVMICIGIGIFMYLGEVVVDREAYESVGFVATVSTAVGLGLLISGYVSLKLSQRLGLINGKPQPPASNEVARSV